VRVFRTQAVLLTAATFAALLGFGACGAPAVGDPCLPEQVPDDGFEISEAYIESSSVQCQTRVCMVWKLQGAPNGSAPCVKDHMKCAAQADVDKKVYCTCRCDAGNSRFAECTCPSGYTCTPVLEQGSEGVRGSYCVLSETVTSDL
jgi:hypothetical protein